MIFALGIAEDHFDARAPGHLCRGRERWIEYEGMVPEDAEAAPIYRAVISGAAFTDDSARDAKRGIPHSTVDVPAVLRALFQDAPMIAYCEEGHPRMVPEGAVGIEPHTVGRPGGPLRQWVSRWVMPCADSSDIERATAAGADVLIVGATPGTGPTPIQGTPEVPVLADAPEGAPAPLSEVALNALFLLTGYRSTGRPIRRFQPTGIPALLEHAEAVVLLHLDKHGPCAGVYSKAPLGATERLGSIGENGAQILVVPFAIPPMLARWDRALWELRQDWDSATRGDFPVPPSPDRLRRQAAAAAAAAEE
jgi:hypothetical protein